MRKVSLATLLVLVGLLSVRSAALPAAPAPQVSQAPPAPVGATATAVALTVAQDAEAPPGSAELTVRVALVVPGPHVPTGNVEFFDEDTSLGTATLSADTLTATLSSTSLSGGPHNFSARYLGDPNFAAASSAVVTFIVIG